MLQPHFVAHARPTHTGHCISASAHSLEATKGPIVVLSAMADAAQPAKRARADYDRGTGGLAGAQHGEDVAQAEVVVRLLGELLLAEAIQHEELLGQRVVLLVAARCQLDLSKRH